MPPALPTGTVTFMFTDVEGSTRLLHELGAEAYAAELGTHRRLVRTALDEHGGVEVDTQGDAFFCAFPSARAASACAMSICARLAETPIRVRIGLHTGEALVADGHYVGIDVHRAARIGACGHGGQIVVSPTTVALLDEPPGPLHDLGEHRLKDLSAPIRLHQLGGDEFPPLKTIRRTNLPVAATPFVGRRDDLAELTRLSSDRAVRLLTLTGPGGTGKTRLALQLAGEISDRFPDGVYFAPLASVRENTLVAPAVAAAVGVEERGGEELGVTLAREIGRTLIVLDNCEHVVDGAADVAGALLASADCLVVATSREPLDLAAERVVPVAPLLRDDALELFYARATAAGATLADTSEERAVVADICADLDGLPLAVELAAARTATVAPAVVRERLGERLDFLRGPRDADERQRTLRTTIAWSYALLAENEQAVFRRFAVFAGGASLDAVQAVCGGDLDDLASLVAKSLVRAGPDGRYWQLETIRQFGADELDAAGETASAEERHARWFAELAAAASGSESARYEVLDAELANLQVAFARLAGSAEPAAAVLGRDLGGLQSARGRYAEAAETLRAALATAGSPRLRATIGRQLGSALVRRGEYDAAWAALVEAERTLETERPRNDGWNEAMLDVKLAQAHFHYWCGNADALARAAETLEPLVAAHATTRQRANFLRVLLQAAYRRERYVLSAETEELARRTFDAAVAAGEWDAHFGLGFALLWRGRLEEAETELEIGLEQARELRDVLQEIRCLLYTAVARRKRGDVPRVRELVDQAAALEDTYGYGGMLVAARAWVALRENDLTAVDRWGSEAVAEWTDLGRRGPTVFQWTARFPLLAADVARGRLDTARAHAAAMLDATQQPLPDELARLLADAAAGEDDALVRAASAGRAEGYT